MLPRCYCRFQTRNSYGSAYHDQTTAAPGACDGHSCRVWPGCYADSGSVSHPVVGMVFKTIERLLRPLIGSTPIRSRQPQVTFR